MFAANVFCLTILALVPVPDKRTPAESASWIGKTVIVINNTVEIGDLTDDLQLNPPLTPLTGLDYRVFGERGDFVQLKTRESVLGWTEKKNVLLVDDAVAYFSRQLELDPNDVTALNHRGWAWKLKGEYEAGIKDMTAAIRTSPETAFYNNRARIRVAAEQYDQAIEDYSKAIELGPQFYLPYSNRGNCWYLMKEYDKAIADFDQSLKLNSRYALGYRSRGAAWQAKRELDKAIVDYSQALIRDPKLAVALADRGSAWLAKGDLAKARKDLDDAIATDRTEEQAFCYRGQLHARATNHEAALADFAEALRLRPRFVAAHLERARTWQSLRQFDSARADLERAIRFDLKNANAPAALAMFLASCPDAKMRNGKRAIQLARHALDLEKSNANAMEALAAALAEIGDFAQAVRVQEQAIASSQLQNASEANRRLELYRQKKAYRQE